MIALREAVSKSREALMQTFNVPESTPIELEEAELEDDGTYWLVTFSYPLPEAEILSGVSGPNLRAILGKRRTFKAIRLLAEDGAVRGVKNLPA